MKIIFLNAWHGERLPELTAFIREHAETTDIFCLQEAEGSTDMMCKDVLSGFTRTYADKYVDERTAYNQSTWVRNGIIVEEEDVLMADTMSLGLGLYTRLTVNGIPVHIVNVHGLPRPGKLDTPERIEQSETVVHYMEQKEGIKIIGGDFNVLPETKSVCMFEEHGYKNLIKDFAITTTRNRFAWEHYPGDELYHSDYIFLKGSDAKSFTVPSLEISDHLPMILEIAQ